MVKSYLRYASSRAFGVICSNTANTVYDRSGKLAICPALESVIIWHVKQGVEVGRWQDADIKCNVTAIARSPDTTNPTQELYAVGYSDGSIRIWNLVSNTMMVVFNGHSGAITSLSFDKSGTRLVSGSKDTDIVIWDVLGECGLCKLRGHKDEVTSLHFINCQEAGVSDGYQPTHVISASKDTLVKVWDIATQHCVETLVNHRNEVWSLAVNSAETRLISGTGDSTLRVWRINKSTLSSKLSLTEANGKQSNDDNEEEMPSTEPGLLFHGHFERTAGAKDRVALLQFSPNGRYLACQTAGKTIEVFQVKTEAELKKKLTKLRKKRTAAEGQAAAGEEDSAELTAKDEIVPFRVIQCSAKVKSLDFQPSTATLTRGDSQQQQQQLLLTALNDNSLAVRRIECDKQDVDTVCQLDLQGHRQDIRSLCISPDDEMLLSAGNETIKLWNLRTGQCMRTLTSSGTFAISSAFLPGSRYVLIGTKTGELELYDTWSCALLETIQAHSGAVWSIEVTPDKKGVVTGGADKEVKFWLFDTKENSNNNLTLALSRTLQLSDEVLSVKISSNQNIVAVSLLDSTVKVFYFDSLKFFLSLYGHKLPVMCMDISSDNTLLVTGSADKNVKLWGLDFGDCHKSIFAHTDSVMNVKFVPGTHYFFTCSKDRTVKYWDGDKFEQIQKLEGHQGEVWAMCLDKWGQNVVTSGHDKSIRVWQKTDEQLFLEEEKEREAEERYEREMIETENRRNGDDSEPHAKSLVSLKAGERIMEAIEMAEQERDKWQAFMKTATQQSAAAPEQNLTLKAMGIDQVEMYVLQILQKIRSADLEEALMVLPFSKVITLLQILEVLISQRRQIPLIARILLFLLRSHHRQIVANRMSLTDSHTTNDESSSLTKSYSHRPRFTQKPLGILLDSIRTKLHQAIQLEKDMIGENLAGLKFIKRLWEGENLAGFVDWEKEMEGKVATVRSKTKKTKTVISN